MNDVSLFPYKLKFFPLLFSVFLSWKFIYRKKQGLKAKAQEKKQEPGKMKIFERFPSRNRSLRVAYIITLHQTSVIRISSFFLQNSSSPKQPMGDIQHAENLFQKT